VTLPRDVYDPPSFILRQLLADLGLVVLPDGTESTPWQGHCVAEPNLPDQVVTLYDTSASDQGRVMYTGERVEDRGCQIRIRGGKYQNDAFLKGKQIADCLDQQVRRTLVVVGANEYMVHAINRKSDVTYIGEDTPTARRKVFTINVTMTVNLWADNYGTGT
jgi:hypothetical protein